MRFIGSLIKYLIYSCIVLIAVGAGLFWFDTGSWLVRPLAQRAGSFFLAPVRVEIDDVSGSLRQGYTLSGLRLISGDKELASLGYASVSPDWDLVLAGMNGLPFVKSLKVHGLSSDLDSVMAIVNLFPSSDDSDAGDEEEDDSSTAFRLNPFSASIRDVNFSTPYAALSLDALTLDEAGNFLLSSRLLSLDNTLPLNATARLNFDPLEVTTSKLDIGENGTGKFTGKLDPMTANLFLTAISLDELMKFAPDFGVRVSGRLDGKFLAKTEGGSLKASGVVSLPRASVMDVPLTFRLPFRFDDSGVFAVDGVSLRTPAASVNLDALANFAAMTLKAKGSAQNISLNEIGRMFAPEAGLDGEGGNINFDVDAVLSGDILGRTRAVVKASMPSITAMGAQVLKDLAANVKLSPGQAPRIDVNGRIFNGKLFARGQAEQNPDGSIKPGAVISIVNLDLPTVVRAFPELAKTVKKPSGTITARVQLHDNLGVDGKITSDRLSANGVTLSDLLAAFGYDHQQGKAALDTLSLRLGRGTIKASGNADINSGVFTFNADARDIEPRVIPELRDIGGTYSLNASGSGNYTDIATITTTASLTARNIAYKRSVIGNVDVPVRFARGVLTIDNAGGQILKGNLSLSGLVDLNKSDFRLAADAENLDLRTLPELRDVKGVYNLTASAHGKYTDIKSINLNADLTASNVGYSSASLGSINLPVRMSGGVLTVNGARADILGGTIALDGNANLLTSNFTAKANATNLELHTIPELRDLKGTYSLTASASGRYSDITAIRAEADLKARGMAYGDMAIGNLNLPLSFANGLLKINGARAVLPGGSVSLKGSVNVKNPANPGLDLTASTQGIDIAEVMKALKVEIQDMPITGKVLATIGVKGSVNSPNVNAAVRAENFKAGTLVDMPTAELVASGNMKRINLNKLEAEINKAQISGIGSLTINQKNIMNSGVKLNANVKRLNLKRILTQAIGSAPVEGMIRGNLNLDGTLAKPALDVKLYSPVIYDKTEIHDIAVKLRAPEADHYVINAGARIDKFRPEADIDLRQKDGVWTYRVDTKPLDIDHAIQTQMPDMAGMAQGFATVSVRGSTKPNSPIDIKAASQKITVLDKITIGKIDIPVVFNPAKNKVEIKKASALLSGGVINSGFEYDLNASEWKGAVKVSHLDFGKLATAFLPEGELVGSVDAEVSMKGQIGVMNTSFATGKFTTGAGYFHKMAALDSITPTKRISFERINGTFFWDGMDLFLNPGTGARAGSDEPLYRYFTVNGSCGVPGKGMKLLCDGRFDLKILDQLLGAMKGVFQYMTGSLARDVIKDAASRVLGIKRKDFQNVSFTIAGTWDKPALENLKITKAIEDFLPIDILNRDQETQKDSAQFRLQLKFPTGPGAKGSEEESTGDQVKQQLLDNLLNWGL